LSFAFHGPHHAGISQFSLASLALRQRVIFELAVRVSKCVNSVAPVYFR